jgi:hypothetical protein
MLVPAQPALAKLAEPSLVDLKLADSILGAAFKDVGVRSSFLVFVRLLKKRIMPEAIPKERDR